MNNLDPPFEKTAPTYPTPLGTYRVGESAPTAWQSAPAAVRFAVWLWSLTAILGFIGAVIGGLIWGVVLLVTLGSM